MFHLPIWLNTRCSFSHTVEHLRASGVGQYSLRSRYIRPLEKSVAKCRKVSHSVLGGLLERLQRAIVRALLETTTRGRYSLSIQILFVRPFYVLIARGVFA
jgi:hypothetical protein